MEPQLIRIGRQTINLANVAYIEEIKGGFSVVFVGDVSPLSFSEKDAEALGRFLADTRYVHKMT